MQGQGKDVIVTAVDRPRTQPDPQGIIGSSGEAGRGAAEAFIAEMLLAFNIADGQVPHVELVTAPVRVFRRAAGFQTNPEQGQLVAESLVPVRSQVAGEIPPLGSILRVRCMISREYKFPGSQGTGEAGIHRAAHGR